MWYDKHRAGCEVWQVPIGEEFVCTCGGDRRQQGLPEHYVRPQRRGLEEVIETALNLGFSTDEILNELGGIQWNSLTKRLRNRGLTKLNDRVSALRQEEWEKRREYDRKRCIHGTWSSSGECEHQKLGRYAKVSA